MGTPCFGRIFFCSFEDSRPNTETDRLVRQTHVARGTQDLPPDRYDGQRPYLSSHRSYTSLGKPISLICSFCVSKATAFLISTR